MTYVQVPWAYYEGARSRRLIHQHSSVNTELKAGPKINDAAYLYRMKVENEKQQTIHAELRRHELAGLIWIVLSPLIAGYTLQYSRYLLSNVDKYISAFNITIFIIAASIKPLSQVILLLQERTIYLQNEASFDQREALALQNRLNSLEKELNSLKRAYVTKKDLGQVKKVFVLQTITYFVRSQTISIQPFSISSRQFIVLRKETARFDVGLSSTLQLLNKS